MTNNEENKMKEENLIKAAATEFDETGFTMSLDENNSESVVSIPIELELCD